MADYIFTVTLKGTGDSPEEAWLDAAEALSLDPGETPDDFMIDDEGISETSSGVYQG